MFGIDLFGTSRSSDLSIAERARMEAHSLGREAARGFAVGVTGANPWKPEPTVVSGKDLLGNIARGLAKAYFKK